MVWMLAALLGHEYPHASVYVNVDSVLVKWNDRLLCFLVTALIIYCLFFDILLFSGTYTADSIKSVTPQKKKKKKKKDSRTRLY
jgi:hypothetical protein